MCYESLSSDEDKQAFEAWHAHDDAEENFCELDGEQCPRSTLYICILALVWSPKSEQNQFSLNNINT